jgi:hypothetical protein
MPTRVEEQKGYSNGDIRTAERTSKEVHRMHIRELAIRRPPRARAGGGSAPQASSTLRSSPHVVARAVIAAFLAMTLTAMMAGGASAHYVYQKGELWGINNKCLHGYSEASHGSGGGYLKVYNLVAQSLVSQYGCILIWNRPANYLRIRYLWFKWNGSRWAVCTYINYRYNTSSTSKIQITRNFGTAPDCGRGYYATQSYQHVKYNGVWNGDGLWSGSHFLPA